MNRRANMNDVHMLARAEGLHVGIGGTKGHVPCAWTDLRLIGRWNECKWVHPLNDPNQLEDAYECAVEWLLCKPESRL